ncbi:hypothetical protein [Streptomyces sp. MNP-20]|uniref:hypothetical protein n=1 Tax=Streptomyces sp. MNP-20 TaxID=2721165 RepID=UPI0035C7D526
MLAAAALAEVADEVNVIERDKLPTGPRPRQGLPQAHHAHLLWSGAPARSSCCCPESPIAGWLRGPPHLVALRAGQHERGGLMSVAAQSALALRDALRGPGRAPVTQPPLTPSERCAGSGSEPVEYAGPRGCWQPRSGRSYPPFSGSRSGKARSFSSGAR